MKRRTAGYYASLMSRMFLRGGTAVSLVLALVVLEMGAARMAAQAPPARPKRPGVDTPGVRIPITKLKPDAVYEFAGAPDWMAVDKDVWVSNSPKNTVARMDPKTATATTFAVGKQPCSGLAAGFGSLWVPNCGDATITRLDLKDGKPQAVFPMSIA